MTHFFLHVCGYYVPKGTRAFVNLWKSHWDPKVWDDPDKFLLERFLTKHSNIDASGQHFEFVLFRFGRRSCLGYTFALQGSHLTLAQFLQGFEFMKPPNMPIDMTEGFGISLPKATPFVPWSSSHSMPCSGTLSLTKKYILAMLVFRKSPNLVRMRCKT